MMQRPMQRLLVEDNPGDARPAAEDGKVRNTLHYIPDGIEATSFMRQEGPHAGAPVPDLILPNSNMPRKDGREVLAEKRNLYENVKLQAGPRRWSRRAASPTEH